MGKEFTIAAKRAGQYVIACDSYDNAPAMQVADEREVFSMLDGDVLAAVVARHRPDIIVPEIEAIRTERLFEMEVPEIFDGTIEVKSISREAGSRTKIAVWSNDENVDPVGACIGPKGQRVSAIVDELGGEKIDVVKYSADPAEFIAAALSPADVLGVELDPEGAKSCKVTVPDHQLSLAIGNKGQNARLAAKLTGWKIDIKPESGFYEPKAEQEEETEA